MDDVAEEGGMNDVFVFLAEYVKFCYGAVNIKNWIKKSRGKTFLDKITPSDIAYCISLIKNSGSVWEQDALMKRIDDDERAKYRDWKTITFKDQAEKDKYARKVPLFTKGENIKRVFGGVMWNTMGKEFYKTSKMNWEAVYASVDAMGVLRKGWNEWQENHKGCTQNHWTNRSATNALWTVRPGEDDGRGDGDEEGEIEEDLDGGFIPLDDEDDDQSNGGHVEGRGNQNNEENVLNGVNKDLFGDDSGDGGGVESHRTSSKKKRKRSSGKGADKGTGSRRVTRRNKSSAEGSEEE